MQKFIKLMFSLYIIIFVVVMSACSSEARVDPGGIDYGNDQSTEEFDTLDDDIDAEIDSETLSSRETNPCPGLDSQLYQLTQSKDPISSAAKMGLKTKDEKVQVLFVLASEEVDFLLDYQVEPGTQMGNQVQGYIPVEMLCELANNEKVLTIRPVDRIY